MALETTVVARQWLSSHKVGSLTDTNEKAVQQQERLFFAVRAEMLLALQADVT
jgi:hypothetical protein